MSDDHLDSDPGPIRQRYQVSEPISLVARWEARLCEGLQMLSAAERGPLMAPYRQQGGSLSLASMHVMRACACFRANVSVCVLLYLPVCADGRAHVQRLRVSVYGEGMGTESL